MQEQDIMSPTMPAISTDPSMFFPGVPLDLLRKAQVTFNMKWYISLVASYEGEACEVLLFVT